MITSLPSQPIVVSGCRSWWTQLPSRERRHAFIDEIIISLQLICYFCLENNSVSNDHKHSILPAGIPIWPNLFAFSSCHGDFASKSNQIVKVQKFWNWSQWNGNFENLQDCRFFPYSKGARRRKRKTHEPQTFSSFLHSLKTFRSNTAHDARVRKK